MYYVYMTEDHKHNKFYIGQHKTDLTEKEDMLKDRYFGKGARIKELIKKHGKSIFTKQILEICEKKEEAEFWELFYIDQYDAINSDDFYNVIRTTSAGATERNNYEMSELKKQYHRDNPGKQSSDMKAFYADPENKKRCLDANARYHGYDDYDSLLRERKEKKDNKTEKYRVYKHLKHVNAQIRYANRSKNKALLGDMRPEERTKRQWEIPEIRKQMVESMKGPRLKTRGMRGIGNNGELSYIDQYFYDLKVHPRILGGWAEAFAIRYRHRKYKSRDNAVKAIRRQCQKINSFEYNLNIEDAIAWYMC